MKKVMVLILSLALGFSLALTMGCQKKPGEEQNKAAEKAAEVNAKVAGWDSCKGCHTDDGKPAPSKATLLMKFKTEKELIAAAKRSKHPMMNNFKKDDLLRRAAKDLGLQ